jgi:Uma2 family endonuclease
MRSPGRLNLVVDGAKVMATMKQANIKLTYHDYVQLTDDKRYELVEGELFLVPAPNLRHQTILGKLWTSLHTHAEANHLGKVCLAPCDVVLCEITVVQPDLLFVSSERRGILTDANVQGAPDLVVEILSPSTGERDLGIKRNLYAKYGVREYWIVDPDAKTVEMLSWSDAGYRTEGVVSQTCTLNSPLFPTLNLALTNIF